jgi:hypothetical protein
MLESLPLLLAPLTLAAAATAQTPPETLAETLADPSADIVVEGGRERAHVYRRMFSRARLQGYLPRWHTPLCLYQTGIADTAAGMRFAARVRDVASAIGAPVGEAGCDSNVIVAWTDNGPELAQTIYRKRPRILTDVVYDAKHEFLRGDAAVRWVPRADLRPPLGAVVGSDTPVALGGATGGTINANVLHAEGASLIREPVTAGMASVLVIIDVDRASGVSLDALADHVAMLALSGVPMGGRQGQLGGSESILTLFEDRANLSMAGLTAADREYLTTLYRIDPNKQEWRQRATLASAVARGLAEEVAALEAN